MGALLERMRQAADPVATGHDFSLTMARALKARVQGLRISTLHGSPEAGERLLSALAAF